ncbi:MAG TPA: preprotein translocase subunit SecG [Anaeromyxobacteraceae bacterium]|nr:preprotein translocase subunit SecG [Anaeromyxobacteraceae bacterium]
MIALVITLHVLVSVFLILVILLQAGKGGGMGAAFGGAGAQTVFGGRGAQTFLGKITSVAAAIFMLTSLALSYQSSRSRSVVAREAAPAPAEASAPAQGGGTPAAPPVQPGR